ncbi:phenylalanyl-tRNA ligase subunit alpha, partial [Halorubrum tebenquichense DSM 14210]
MRLTERQLAVLEAASATDERTVAEIGGEIGLKPETVAGAAFDLADEGLVEVASVTDETLELTDEGRTYVDGGLPETRLYRAGIDAGADADPVSMGAVIGEADLDGPEVDIALANFARKGFGSVDGGELSIASDADPDADPEAAALAALADAGEAGLDAGDL